MIKDKTKLKEYFNKVAPRHHHWRSKNRYYYSYIESHISFIVPQGKKCWKLVVAQGNSFSV